jgi:formate--tetrahydrofolate ligase
MVKTQFSLSHESSWKGVPSGWTLPVRDILVYTGAKFICPVSGDISLMPGTGSNPAFRHVDVDTSTGKVIGLS